MALCEIAASVRPMPLGIAVCLFAFAWRRLALRDFGLGIVLFAQGALTALLAFGVIA